MKYFVALLAFGLFFQLYNCDTSLEENEIGDALAITAKPAVRHNMGTQDARAALRKKLFNDDYDPKNIPDGVDLAIGMYLIKFDVNEERETMETIGWLNYMWNDNRLTWDAEETGIHVLRVSPHEVWKPDLSLYNNADPENMMNCGETNVLIYANGKMLWVQPCRFSSHCHLNFTQTPEGPEQSCYLKFGSWTYDGNSMGLSLQKNETKANTNDMYENNKYILTKNTATWENKYYSCCKEPYPNIRYDFSFRKKAEFCY
jgi:hypothetical protein